MIYAILGVLVLVASFVIALVTLIKEQNKLDGDRGLTDVNSEPVLAKELSEEQPVEPAPVDVTPATSLSEDLVAPQDNYLVSSVNAKVLPEDSDLHTVDPEVKSHVWWEQLDDAGEGKGKGEEESDQESIRKVREELAKLMASRKSDLGTSKEPEANKFEDDAVNLTKADVATTLSGEFSLKDIQNKD